MALMRDLKQSVTNGIEDLSKLTQLAVEDTTEEIKHQMRKEKMQQKVDDLKEGYTHMKQSIKDEFES